MPQRREEKMAEVRRRRRREVGCQWESPAAGRKEVGCQSDAAVKRDAAIQVDLLTQQLSRRHTGEMEEGPCDLAWSCVSIRADQPGGGALLQHCSSERTAGSPALNLPCASFTGATQLPTIHQWELPQETSARPQPEPPLSNPLPSMPLCGTSPTMACGREPSPAPMLLPPAGLIAPLSPHLDEEEQEEEACVRRDHEDCLRSDKRASITMKKKRRKPEPAEHGARGRHTSGGRMQPLVGRRPRGPAHHQRRKVDEDEQSQPSGRSSVSHRDSETGSCRSLAGAGRPVEQIQRTHSRASAEEEEDEEEEEQEEEGSGEKTEQARRQRRRMVGPPIRYLIESEELALSKSAANQSRMREVKVKRQIEEAESTIERKEEEEQLIGDRRFQEEKGNVLMKKMEKGEGQLLEERRCQDEGAEQPTKTETDKKEQVRRSKRMMLRPPIRYCSDSSESEEQSHDPPAANQSRAKELKLKRQIEEAEESSMLLKRKAEEEQPRVKRRSQEEEEQEEEVSAKPLRTNTDGMEQARRPRRIMVGPPIRYLIESEEESCSPSAANQSRANGLKLERQIEEEEELMVIKRKEEEEQLMEEMRSQEEEEEEQEEVSTKPLRTNTDEMKHARRSRRMKVRSPIRYLIESVEQSHDSPAANQNRVKELKVNRPMDEAVKKVELMVMKRKEEEELVVVEEEQEEVITKPLTTNTDEMEQVRRPRRTMVGPPIRYLIESEEESCSPSAANQSRAKEALLKRQMEEAVEKEESMVMKRKEEEEQLMEERRCREEGAEQEGAEQEGAVNREGVKQTKTEERQQLRRSKRMKVRSPIRYLTESVEQSHDPPAANQSRANGLKLKRQIEEAEEKEESMLLKRKEEEEQPMEDRRSQEEEEQEEEQEEVSAKPLKTNTDETKQARRPRRTMVGPPIRYLIESVEQLHDPPAANQSRAKEALLKRQMEEAVEKEESMVMKRKEEEEELVMGEEEQEELGTKPLTINTDEMEQARRPRRTMVGPPIRYLIESEEEPCSPSAANQSRVEEMTVRRQATRLRGQEKRWKDRRRGVEPAANTGSGGVSPGDRGVSLEDRGVSLEDRGVSLEGMGVSLEDRGVSLEDRGVSLEDRGMSLEDRGVSLEDRGVSLEDRGVSLEDRGVSLEDRGVSLEDRGVSLEDRGDDVQTYKMEKELRSRHAAPNTPPDWLEAGKHERRNPQWLDDCQTSTKRRRDGKTRKRELEKDPERRRCGQEEEELQKQAREQPDRPRRTRAGPPIRYLLQSEEQEGAREPQKKRSRTSEEMIDRREDAGPRVDHVVGQEDWTNHDTANGPQQGREPVTGSAVKGGASEEPGLAKRRAAGLVVLVYRDLHSGHMTIVPPCFVRLQQVLHDWPI